MDDIKDAFLKVALNELDRTEKYMGQKLKEKIAQWRWELFVKNFIESKDVLNYANGNWTK